MNSLKLSGRCAMALIVSVTGTTFASTNTIGPNGINSAGLQTFQGVSLTGAGIAIGQVELQRPGDPSFDMNGTLFHSSVNPAAVFFRDPGPPLSFNPTMDDPNAVEITSHAVWVGGVMISTDNSDPDMDGDSPIGVVPNAELYSVGYNPFVPFGPSIDDEVTISAQHLAALPGVNIRAINMSFAIPLLSGQILDGNQHLTQYVDWSAGHHEILYVVAGNQTGDANSVPTDNFNGMTIATSQKVGNVYRRVATRNRYDQDAEGERTSIALIAPGESVKLASVGDVTMVDSGTSYAAPHVTGTVALLQQYANERIMNAGGPLWKPDPNANARRHEVMKAVLMNSADKLIDDGSVVVGGNPVAPGNLLGMTRTVLKQDGASTFLDSFAYDDTAFAGLGESTPLDEEMGTGHLNASRALTQFLGGEYDADAADVPVIGWDYGTTTGEDDFNRYRFGAELRAGSFISITLAWDRHVEFANDADMDGEYDIGDTFEPYVEAFPAPPDDEVINDLDLYLLPRNAPNLGSQIAASRAKVGTVEHLFF